MGFKRAYDAENVQEFNVKHARQIGYSTKLSQLDGAVPYHVSLEKSSVLGEDLSDLFAFKCDDKVEDAKQCYTDAPFSWIITDSFEEDSQSGGTTQSSLSHESPESDFTWKPVCLEEEDGYLYQNSPRKPVPIGPNHQADIPECVKEEASDYNSEKSTGSCIIPMPDCEINVCKAGEGRKECICSDKGSIRCVQQHIMENREYLFETIGYERCLKLGLCEMGEEIAGKFTEDEEDRFHEIVYSNPASLDRDFWIHLKAAFPSRTMKDIVSYYFNVFILRRRAIQNHSKTLDIDSDDDEWQLDYDNSFYGTESPDENNYITLLPSEDNDDSNYSDEDEMICKDKEEVNIEDESNVIYSRFPVKHRDPNIGNYWRHCNDVLDQFDPCNSILADPWGKSIDLLPTSNMIEEIFAQDVWDDFK